ncbi:Basic-leucine zipper domain-containing protein [Dioscorea alata]|uniref:Basic-leucine zipper domain-containing protein n=1 Tax=Dioscorea alata TaxID=55571 RepID=A0ACB7WB73_DIOAL|nr:Basic-leucine zipper domain-containing protein [Dioscorea alata]
MNNSLAAGSDASLNLAAASSARTEMTESSSSSSFHGPLGLATMMFSTEISEMPDFPPFNSGHRRAHSDNLGYQYDFRFDGELRVVGSGADEPSSDDTDEDVFAMFIDTEKLEADLPTATEASAIKPADVAVAASEIPARIGHRRSLSAEGSSAMRAETVVGRNRGTGRVESRRAISSEQLEELALVDPKRAKRIRDNRLSAARSKEKKMRYMQELEMRLQALRAEAAALSAEFSMLQREIQELTFENHELRMQVQLIEQQIQIQDAVNDSLREERQRLRFIASQLFQIVRLPIAGPAMNYGQQFIHPNPPVPAHLPVHQLQQLQIHQPQQLQIHQPQLPAHQNQLQQNPEQPLVNLMNSSPSSSSSSSGSTDLEVELSVSSADPNENPLGNTAAPME